MPYKNLLFDLDGTLIDPKTGITKAIAYALKFFDIVIPESEYDTLTPFIGPPLVESFARYYGFDEDTSKAAVAKYREYYAVTGLFECHVYPGIKAALEQLKASGYALYLATSKPEPFAKTILGHLGLLDCFDRVAGSALDHSRDHKAQVIAWLMEQAQLKPEESLMVGDRSYDIEGARICGIETVAVTYGYGSPEEFDTWQPAYRVDSAVALAELLLSLKSEGSTGSSS